MRIKRRTLTTLVMIACVIPVALQQNAAGQKDMAEPEVFTAEENVSSKTILSYFKAAFLKADLDKDGDIRIKVDGITTFVRLDKTRKLITYFTFGGMRESVSEVKKLRFVNRLNNDMIFVRFRMSGSSTLYCDYQVSYENGIAPYSIVNSYHLFAKVVKGAVSSQDPNGIISSD